MNIFGFILMKVCFIFLLLVGSIIGLVFLPSKGITIGHRTMSLVIIIIMSISIFGVLRLRSEDLLPPPRPSINHEVPTPESSIGDAINTTDFNPDSI